ncbi:hypothetical protein BN14_09558 [Rhizoctonia solani AG-1 IB]|uniref:Uncharacterized protein n=1 Tax=Thanatephorus cucumeris (strain AG1-IB / isolate 7/3/14) TaxID=1108050 RepID=M5C8R4_THACB|nr:hypothetical protein BN14_09558 [Rhizoctonia solani AG-1 IB]
MVTISTATVMGPVVMTITTAMALFLPRQKTSTTTVMDIRMRTITTTMRPIIHTIATTSTTTSKSLPIPKMAIIFIFLGDTA